MDTRCLCCNHDVGLPGIRFKKSELCLFGSEVFFGCWIGVDFCLRCVRCPLSAVRCPLFRVIPVLFELPLTNNRLGHAVLGSQLAEGCSSCFVVSPNLGPVHIAHDSTTAFANMRLMDCIS